MIAYRSVTLYSFERKLRPNYGRPIVLGPLGPCLNHAKHITSRSLVVITLLQAMFHNIGLLYIQYYNTY